MREASNNRRQCPFHWVRRFEEGAGKFQSEVIHDGWVTAYDAVDSAQYGWRNDLHPKSAASGAISAG